jgi:hypothetical protein
MGEENYSERGAHTRQPLHLHRRGVLPRAAKPLAAGADDGRGTRSSGHPAGGGRFLVAFLTGPLTGAASRSGAGGAFEARDETFLTDTKAEPNRERWATDGR